MPIPLTVMGTDVKGQVFTERTFLLGLQGRDCRYQSKHEVPRNGWVLLDFDNVTGGRKPAQSPGRVKSLQTSPTNPRLFQIAVELESAQAVAVVPDQQAVPSKSEGAPKANSSVAATQVIAPEAGAKLAAQILALIGKTAKPVESDPPSVSPKGVLSREMEDSIRVAVASLVDRVVQDNVEKGVRQQYEAAIQPLLGDFAHQLTLRLTESEPWRASCASVAEIMAEIMAERLNKRSEQALAAIEDEWNLRVAALRQSAEGALAQMQGRMNAALANVEDALAGAQAVKGEVRDAEARIREALQQVRDADLGRLLSQLDAWSGELKKRLDDMITESTAAYVRSMEEQMVPHFRAADEKLQTLAAGLQLAQMQQDRLRTLSQAAAANCEKEMRAFFLRLSTSI